MRRGIWKYNSGQEQPRKRTAPSLSEETRPVINRIKPPSNLPIEPKWRGYLQNSLDTYFLGIPCSQWHSDLWLWEKFFLSHRVASMIEIGTGKGGTSLFFLLQGMQRGFSFNTFDIVKPIVLSMPIGHALHFDLCFYHGDVKKELKTQVEEMLKDAPHPILLFCDGGDKVWEVQTFSKQLTRGDYVAVHDWNKSFRKKDMPANLELTFDRIAEVMGSYSRWMKVK